MDLKTSFTYICALITRVCITYICVCVRGAVTRKPHNEVPSAGCPAVMTVGVPPLVVELKRDWFFYTQVWVEGRPSKVLVLAGGTGFSPGARLAQGTVGLLQAQGSGPISLFWGGGVVTHGSSLPPGGPGGSAGFSEATCGGRG